MQIYDVKMKRGMKLRLKEDHADVQAKAGDIVKVTSVTAMGCLSDGTYNDYENLRVSNGKFSWRVCREELESV